MRSIRWKLLLTSFLIVFAPLYYLNRHVVKSFDLFSRQALEEEMIGQATALGAFYKAMWADSDACPETERASRFRFFIRDMGTRLQAHFSVLSPDGVVRFDSDSADREGLSMLDLPEIAKAAAGRYGARWKLSEDSRFVYYYVALPIKQADEIVGIACISRHTGQITKAIVRLVYNQRVALLTALCFAALASTVVAQTMTRRLRKLTKAAVDYAAGGEPLALPAAGRDEIGELTRAVVRMAGEIERRNQYNREFVSTVMHELKTPLTAIKGATEILSDSAGGDAGLRRKFLANIRVESDRMIRLVGELTELTRIDTAMPRAELERVDYGEFVRTAVERILPTLADGHAPITVRVPERKIHARVVPGRIERVLANLLENAVRYTPAAGQVEVLVEEAPPGAVATTVRDNGCGIASANINRVFDRFFTTESKVEPGAHGSGLGLAIARSIVEQHQGSIEVASAQGQGAAFRFTLPAAASAASRED